jgi:vWA found in TerF C terminus
MFYKVILKNEVQVLPLQGKVKQFSIVIDGEWAGRPIHALCVAKDAKGDVLKAFSIPSSYTQSEGDAQTALQWVEPSRRDKPTVLALNVDTELFPVELTECLILLGGEAQDASGGVNTKIQIRCGIHTWESTTTEAIPAGLSCFKSLAIERGRYEWRVRILSEWLAESKSQSWDSYTHQLIQPPVKAVEAVEISTESVIEQKPVEALPHYLSFPEPLRSNYLAIRNELDLFGVLDYPIRCVVLLEHTEAMRSHYESGEVAQWLSEVAALAGHSSPHAALEIILANEEVISLGSVEGNRASAFPVEEWLARHPLGTTLPLTRLIETVRRTIYPANQGEATRVLCANEDPVWVMVLCSSGIEKDVLTDWQLRWSSREPLFWHFLSLSPEFATKEVFTTFQSLPDLELPNVETILIPKAQPSTDVMSRYQRMLEGYVVWLDEAVQKKVVRGRGEAVSKPLILSALDDIFA